MNNQCPKCGEKELIRVHSDYITHEIDFYLCETCEHEWIPEK